MINKKTKNIMLGAFMAFALLSTASVVFIMDSEDTSAASITSVNLNVTDDFAYGSAFPTVSSPAEDTMYTTTATWQKSVESTTGWVDVGATETPVSGTNYRMVIKSDRVSTADSFATASAITIKVKVGSGEPKTLVSGEFTRAVGVITVYVYYSTPTPSIGVRPSVINITEANVTTNGTFAVGQSFPTYSVAASENYTVSAASTKWQKMSATGWVDVPAEETAPITGNIYRAVIVLTPKTVYEFETVSIVLKIDGNDNVITTKSTTGLTSYVEILPESSGAEYIAGDYTSTVALEYLPTGITSSELSKIPVVLPANIELYSATFSNGGSALEADKKTVEGVQYKVVLVLTTKDGYWFKNTGTTYSIPGATTAISAVTNDSDKVLLQVTITLSPSAKTMISIDDVKLNTPGELTADTQISSYVVGNGSSLYSIEYKWYLKGSTTALASNAKFAEGSEYVLKATLTAKNNALFDTSVNYSGIAGVSSSEFVGDDLVLTYSSLEAVSASAEDGGGDDGGMDLVVIASIAAVILVAIFAVACFFLKK